MNLKCNFLNFVLGCEGERDVCSSAGTTERAVDRQSTGNNQSISNSFAPQAGTFGKRRRMFVQLESEQSKTRR